MKVQVYYKERESIYCWDGVLIYLHKSSYSIIKIVTNINPQVIPSDIRMVKLSTHKLLVLLESRHLWAVPIPQVIPSYTLCQDIPFYSYPNEQEFEIPEDNKVIKQILKLVYGRESD